MANDSCVLDYSRAIVTINFVKGEERCKYCPLYGITDDKRPQCRRTGEYIVNTLGRGRECPLMFEEVDE